jgi:hypothetical protein
MHFAVAPALALGQDHGFDDRAVPQELDCERHCDSGEDRMLRRYRVAKRTRFDVVLIHAHAKTCTNGLVDRAITRPGHARLDRIGSQ